MPTVRLRSPLREVAGGNSAVEVEGGTLGDVVRRLQEQHPRLTGWILDERGFVREHPGVAALPVEHMVGDAVVLDLSFRCEANAQITPEDLEQAERALNARGHRIEPGGTILLRTDWPRGHVTTDPKWWNDSPCLTRQAAEWLVAKQPAVLGYDFAQEEKGSDYEHADEILGSGMRVHRTILPRVVFQIENLINLDQIPSKVRLLALPAKWRSESAPARVLALVD